ncbi:MAG: dihydroorotase [Acutalibacteraceae bacterium]
MLLFKNATYYTTKGPAKGDLFVDGGKVFEGGSYSPAMCSETIDASGLFIVPGFADVHVHLREPGFFYKESIESGTLCGAKGGYTALCAMPNLNPVPDSKENLDVELAAIRSGAKIDVYPYGALTVGEKGKELSDIEGLAPEVIAFSDDGKGVQNPEKMKEAMLRAKACGKIIAAHCEDESLLDGGYVHAGRYAAAHGHKGISSESEWKMVERDVALAAETGVAYHVCHVSTKESVEIIRKAKAAGVNVTAETAPHYLVLCEDDLQEDGRFKMNPPLRSREDREALRAALADGTLDMIATDHAPHSDEEKSRGLKGSLMGVIGLESAFAVLYTELVRKGIIPFERLIYAMSTAPCRRFGIAGGDIYDGAIANLAVLDLSKEWTVRGQDSASKGNSTPFEGRTVCGKNIMTIYNGEIIWKE